MMAGKLLRVRELHLAGKAAISTILLLLDELSGLATLSLSDCGLGDLSSGPSSRFNLLRTLSVPLDSIGFLIRTNADALPSLEHLTLTTEYAYHLIACHLESLPSVTEQLKAHNSFSGLSLEMPLHCASEKVEEITQDERWTGLPELLMSIKFEFKGSGRWSGALPPLRKFSALRHLRFKKINETCAISALECNGDIKSSLLTLTINAVPQDFMSLLIRKA